VPPLAQLKLLKAMQVVVNGQTKTVDVALKASTTDADKNQYQTEAQNLGAKEGKIHDMSSQIVDDLLEQQDGGMRQGSRRAPDGPVGPGGPGRGGPVGPGAGGPERPQPQRP
jgi:hypothetical protein